MARQSPSPSASPVLVPRPSPSPSSQTFHTCRSFDASGGGPLEALGMTEDVYEALRPDHAEFENNVTGAANVDVTAAEAEFGSRDHFFYLAGSLVGVSIVAAPLLAAWMGWDGSIPLDNIWAVLGSALVTAIVFALISRGSSKSDFA